MTTKRFWNFSELKRRSHKYTSLLVLNECFVFNSRDESLSNPNGDHYFPWWKYCCVLDYNTVQSGRWSRAFCPQTSSLKSQTAYSSEESHTPTVRLSATTQNTTMQKDSILLHTVEQLCRDFRHACHIDYNSAYPPMLRRWSLSSGENKSVKYFYILSFLQCFVRRFKW